MERPERLVGSGTLEAPEGELSRKFPKTEAMLPGATGAPAPKLAPFTTPPALMEGPPDCPSARLAVSNIAATSAATTKGTSPG
jgi:hypothetical protein